MRETENALRRQISTLKKNFIMLLILLLAFMSLPVSPAAPTTVFGAQLLTSPADGEESSEEETEETAVTDEGDGYETKLSAKNLIKSIYQNQSDVPLAKINFSKTATRKGISVKNGSGKDICSLCSEADEEITYSYDEQSQIVSVSVSPNAKKGVHSAVIYAEGEDENSYQTFATVKFTVLRRIDSIFVAADDFLCIDPSKGCTWTPKITINPDAYRKKVVYEIVDFEETPLAQSSVLKGYMTLNQKNGSVKLSKAFSLSEDPAKNKFKLRVHASDYSGNETEGCSPWVRITDTVSPIDRIVPITYGEMNDYQINRELHLNPSLPRIATNPVSAYDGQELANKYFVALDRDGCPIREVSWSVSGPVKMRTQYDKLAASLETTGPGRVILTAKTRDGEKTQLNFKIALDKEPSLQVSWAEYKVDSGGKGTKAGTRLRCYNVPADRGGNKAVPCDALQGEIVNVYVGEQRPASDTQSVFGSKRADTQNAFKIKLSVEGAKIVKRNSYRDIDIIPTAEWTTITMVNNGVKSKPVTTMVLHNLCMDAADEKNSSGKKSVSVRTSQSTIYSGTWYQNSGKTGQKMTVTASGISYKYATVTIDKSKWKGTADGGIIGTYPVTNGQFEMEWGPVNNGSIPLLVSYGNSESKNVMDSGGSAVKQNVFLQKTLAMPITIKVKKPATPKVSVVNRLKPDGPHSCYLLMENYARLTNVRSIHFDKVLNLNVKGSYNRFTDIFYIDQIGGKDYIRARSEATIPKEGIYGWVHYTYKTRVDDLEHYGWQKILIKP